MLLLNDAFGFSGKLFECMV